MPQKQTWLIVGASRGIGLEFTSQLLSHGHIVIATARAPATAPPINITGSASKLWSLTGTPNGHNLTILECDVSDEESIKAFTERVRKLGRKGCVLESGSIDVVVLNAGVLEYPGRISEISFSTFQHHLNTNTIGPLLTASSLLSLSHSSPSTSPPSIPTLTSTPTLPQTPLSPFLPLPLPSTPTPISIRTLVFISSDSGSTTLFRSHEDGFGVYSASKAALNQGLRHLAAELALKRMQKQREKQKQKQKRKEKESGEEKEKESEEEEEKRGTIVLAIHPGEVATDMAANINSEWEVEGIITPQESVRCMLKVIREKGWGGVDEGGVVSRSQSRMGKGEDGEATFWTWEGRRYPW